ncbi:MAG: substrate-binding domain-containing protein, partial [Nostocaceae cyanobacterium]|nr:substrate-binding domain-containing protein [Nostocaceae cyanobacterium]
MSQKNETKVLVLALAVTLGIVGAGVWWVMKRPGFNLPGGISTNQSQPLASNVENFAQVPQVPSGLFSYGGSTTWAPIRKEVDLAIGTVWPQFQLRYTDPTTGAPGSASGIKMLLSNQLAFAQSSRTISSDEYQQAKQQGFT